MTGRLEIHCVEYHTAGEPYRILSGGFGPIPGADMLAKRRYAAERLDRYRRLVVNEPRGHADMYGCFVTEPVDARSAFGMVFFHNAGYSTACGHGTIAGATWAVESGLVPPDTTELWIDVPSGTMRTRIEGGAVAFENVPSWVHSRGHDVAGVRADVSYGGAFYASVEAPVPVEPAHVGRFIELGRAVKAALEERVQFSVAGRPDIAGIYGVIFFERLGPGVQRNVTVFADGEVDRSPCGSGTSARLALLDGDGELPRGSELRHLGIVGTEFRARVTGERHGGVVTEVSGSAHLAGHHVFVLEPGDPLPDGFVLR